MMSHANKESHLQLKIFQAAANLLASNPIYLEPQVPITFLNIESGQKQSQRGQTFNIPLPVTVDDDGK